MRNAECRTAPFRRPRAAPHKWQTSTVAPGWDRIDDCALTGHHTLEMAEQSLNALPGKRSWRPQINKTAFPTTPTKMVSTRKTLILASVVLVQTCLAQPHISDTARTSVSPKLPAWRNAHRSPSQPSNSTFPDSSFPKCLKGLVNQIKDAPLQRSAMAAMRSIAPVSLPARTMASSGDSICSG